MALRRDDRDLPALTVLALLATGPRHTYEMHRLMIDTHKDFVTGLPRSMYHAVERLGRDELITVHGTERVAGRPERTLYALTAAGRVALHARVARLLEHPEPDATLLVAALSFLACLAPPAAAAALTRRAAVLDDRLAGMAVELATVPDGLPRVLLVEAEYEKARLTAERDWVRALAADITSGRLTWPDDLASLIPPEGDLP